MITSEVQRTLVKSPPELWSELSDPAALGRHLGEFGEIRITRVEPETTVAWEADDASGEVLIKPSGWGTKVILKASRKSPMTQPTPDPEPQPAPDPQPASEAAASDAGSPCSPATPPGAAAEASTAPEEDDPPGARQSWPARDPDAMLGPATTAGLAKRGRRQELDREEKPQEDQRGRLDPPARQSFFARLFRWRAKQQPSAPESTREQPPSELHADDSPVGPVPDQDLEPTESTAPGEHAPAEPEALEAPPTEPAAKSLAAAPQQAEEAIADEGAGSRQDQPAQPEEPLDGAVELQTRERTEAEEVTAVLTSMLDRLGTAHHRPFSRA